MTDLINIPISVAGLTALLGYAVVFFGLILLMFVVMIVGRIMVAKDKKAAPTPVEEPASPIAAAEAPGTAGELKLYDTDPRDAAMVMAIIADTLGKPLNQLRFISIKEVKDDEI